MRLSDRSPRAIAYDTMPGYQASADMLAGLLRTTRWLGEAEPGLAKVVMDRAIHTVLTAAEAGARVLDPARRETFYRDAWFTTHDCESLLDAATDLGAFPRDARLGADSMIRTAQQQLTIASGAMLRRAKQAL